MKKNLIYLVTFIILLAVAGWLISENTGSSTLEGPENYSFSIKDTAAISKIVLSDKTPSRTVLTRESRGWLVDGEDPARDDAMEIILETMYRMEMRNFSTERIRPEVIKHLEVFGKRVEIFQNGELYKTIIVGLPTHDEMGTWMMIEGADAPYAVHIPGFNGFLSSRFFTESYLWKRRDLVRMDPRNIKEVEVIYPDSLNASYTLRVFSPDSIYFVRASDGEVMSNVSVAKARMFLGAFKNLSYEGEIIPSDPIYARRDSLKSSTPAFTIMVKDIDGKLSRFSAYKIKGEAQTVDFNDPTTFYDRDRLHGFINNDRMVLLQYYGLRKVIKPLSYFINSES
tara:strand:+ start:147136 stop:148155 length:1020 start_codon:yes stop_codon:yes gene_type:complete